MNNGLVVQRISFSNSENYYTILFVYYTRKRLLGGELFQFMGNDYSDITDNKFNDFFFLSRAQVIFFF